ncbi:MULTISPECIES: hypothetical protein [Pseudomonadaceae]|uniref:hypothetical protein n=1 Tax=Pseudomonadaceae TaxID=135621 RepID=UPI0015E3A575|nr:MULTISPECIES: hypothetical protein [Pseudomonadaceae]MBA1265524.1 hypothetical protein [Stutzerimonas stutzeri]
MGWRESRFGKWQPAFGLQGIPPDCNIPKLLFNWIGQMSVQGNANPPQSKKALRQVLNAVGYARASWAAYVGTSLVGCVGYAVLEPVTNHMPLITLAITYIAVLGAFTLADHLYLQPWHGSRILRSIAVKHGPKTSAHVYGMFVDEEPNRPRINIPEIARQYGERP